jgi:hypothetical protein
MDKRKVNGGVAAGEELNERAAKRRKLPSVSLFLGHVGDLCEYAIGELCLLVYWWCRRGVERCAEGP